MIYRPKEIVLNFLRRIRMKRLKNSLFIFMVLPLMTCSLACAKMQMKRPPKPPVPKMFCMATANIDGSNYKEIISDPTREMNHARISNDHKWVTFTRYNKLHRGVAVEEAGYKETEIMICKIDGTELQTIVPPKKNYINGNGSWTPDNKGIIYVSTDTISKAPELFIVDVATKKRKKLPTPAGYFPTDPHMVGDWVIFPAKTKQEKHTSIYIMKKDGTNFRRVTHSLKGSKGDYDPRLSPDAKKTTVFRQIKGTEEYHLVVHDLVTNKEKDLSSSGVIEGVAHWSSDGKLLAFWQLNIIERRKEVMKSMSRNEKSLSPLITNIFIIRPDGTQRKKVPLPASNAYTMPAFFPKTGSDKNSKIVFSVRKFK